MKRHNARILAVMVLFNIDMNHLEINETDVDAIQAVTEEVMSLILDEDYQVEIDYTLSDALIHKAVVELNHIDEKLINSLVGWTLDRLSYVDRAILRVAVTEMLMKNLPKQVILDEYLEITREYAMTVDEKQVKFNNKVLDVLAKSIYE